MPDQTSDKKDHPPTLLEVLFNAIDTVARRVSDVMPLGRGIRDAMSSHHTGIIDWTSVRQIAIATLEMSGDKPAPASQKLVDQYQVMLRAANREVVKETGLKEQGLPERVDVFSQPDWVDANIVTFRFLFDPISDKYAAVMSEAGRDGQGMNRFASGMLTVQVGVIIGYLARNVLGQFDLSLPEPHAGGKLYIVEPNVKRIEQQMGMDPTEFRQWIVLHEATHSFEFSASPWLRGYLVDSMREYLASIDWRGMSSPDFFKKMRQQQKQQPDEDDALKAGGLISIVSTPEQRRILAKIQATMSVLEGFSNHVMDMTGSRLLETYPEMKERFDRRRDNKSAAEKLFQRLIGLNLKMDQYRIGQQFVDFVVAHEDIQFMNKVWQSQTTMPTMEELRQPELWIARIKLPRIG